MNAERKAHSALPPDRAFVVQLGSETEIERGSLEGRVEHIVSGRATRFQTLEGLVAFFGCILTPHGGVPDTGTDRNVTTKPTD